MSLRANPLSPGRASPFRRPESPSPSPSSPSQQQQQQKQQQQQQQGGRPTTPTAYGSTRPATPSKLHNSSLANADGTWSPSSPLSGVTSLRPAAAAGRGTEAPQLSPTRAGSNLHINQSSSSNITTGSAVGNGISNLNLVSSSSSSPYSPSPTVLRGSTPRAQPQLPSSSSPSLSRTPFRPGLTDSAASTPSRQLAGDALSKLPAAQVRELREAFQILDRDADGFVGREDVADMLAQVGLADDAAAVNAFFPASSGGQVSMANFLAGIAGALAQMSAPAELLAALAAFDDDDSGQIDVGELADALMHTAPEPGDGGARQLTRDEVEAVMQEFTGKRAFSKYGATSGLGKGEVFRYREWVAGLGAVGGNQADKVQTA